MVFTFDPINILIIIGVACASTLLSELLSWVLLYRKQSFKTNKTDVQKLNKTLEKLKNKHVPEAQNKSHEKKITQTEAQLKQISQSMMFQSMKGNILIGLVMIGVVNFMGTYFLGVVVAILPFEPFSLLRGITHRNIAGQNYYESSYLFIYILFTFIIRANLKKIFGFQPPKPAVSFFEPPKPKNQ